MAEPRAVSVTLQKGGVGKTIVAINVAERLAARGHDVLLADLDQQGNATEGVGLGDAYTADKYIKHILFNDAEVTDLVRPAAGDTGFDVLPGHRDLDEVEDKLRNSSFGVVQLQQSIVEPLLGDEYDYIVFDNPPDINPLSDASVVATRNLLVPLRMREQSVAGFRRMIRQQMAPLRQQVDVDILALVPNLLRGDNEEEDIIQDLEESKFKEKLPAFGRSNHWERTDSPGPGIRQDIDVARAWREGVPLGTYNPDNSPNLERFEILARIVENGGVQNG